LIIEFAAGVQHGQRDLRCRALLRGVHLGRDAATVVDDGRAAVHVEDRFDCVAKAGHGFVDAVVHHLVHQVVQPIDTSAPDVHRRPLANGLQPLQDLDLLSSVPGCGLGCHRVPAVAFTFSLATRLIRASA
jgi:hypothetical protein